jgi:beta-glucanase (GH16 family)
MIRKGLALVAAVSFLLLGQQASNATVAPKVVTAPSITKYATVGSTVRVTHAKFNQTAKLTTAWYYNGKAIAGATGATYKVTAKQATGTLQARESAKFGAKTLTTVSNIINIGKLYIVGNASIAYTDGTQTTLKATPPTQVLPAPTEVQYQWLRNGFDIPNETTDTHTVATSDKDALVSVKITYIAPRGYLSKDLKSTELRPAALVRTYTQLWSDEFNGAAGAAPDSSIWTPQNGDGSAERNRGWGNNELEYYKAELATTDGSGSLVVHATTDGASAQTCYYGPCTWFSSKYITKGKIGFKYGRIEARIKGAPGAGTWNAFWALGANDTTTLWPSCGEIDYTELIGRSPNDVLGYSHGPVSRGGGRGNTTTLASDWSNDYHTYAVDWLPDQLTWYVDGQVYGTVDKYDNDWKYDHEFYLIFNLAMGGNLGGDVAPGLTSTSMKIDWVRFSSINGVGEVITH